MSNGKGHTRRPRAITRAEEADRWDATFRGVIAQTNAGLEQAAEHVMRDISREVTGTLIYPTTPTVKKANT